MKNSSRDILGAAALSLAVFCLYISFLSKAYVFEGLIRAMPIETGRWLHLLAGNYLLYGPLGLIFHTLLRFLGFHWPAVNSLQILDSVLGAGGIFVFYFTLRRLGGDRWISTVWAGLLAFSLGYWLWSTEAEDYILSTFLLLVNFYFLVRYIQEGDLDPLLLGALHGLAILGHIVNTVFGAVILGGLIATHGTKWKRPALRYGAGMAVVAGGAYAAVLFGVRSPTNLHDALIWLAGSAGAKTDGIYWGGGWTADKWLEWLKMSLHIFGSFLPEYKDPAGWRFAPWFVRISVLLLGSFAIAFGLRANEIYHKHRAVVVACGLWIFVYAGVFSRWEPQTMVYRVSDLVPLCTLLFLGYQSIPANRKIWRGVATFMVFCLGVGNLGAEIYPRSFGSNNPSLKRMAFLKAHTVDTDWITGDGGQDEIYIPYFAERRPLVVERYRREPQVLVERINSLLDQKQAVFVTSRVLDKEKWKEFFRAYTLTLKADDANGFALYRVERYHEKHVP